MCSAGLTGAGLSQPSSAISPPESATVVPAVSMGRLKPIVPAQEAAARRSRLCVSGLCRILQAVSAEARSCRRALDGEMALAADQHGHGGRGQRLCPRLEMDAGAVGGPLVRQHETPAGKIMQLLNAASTRPGQRPADLPPAIPIGAGSKAGLEVMPVNNVTPGDGHGPGERARSRR